MDIAVIGCGVIGLTTGIELSRIGHRVTIYADTLPPGVTSNVASAIWLPLWTNGADTVSAEYNNLLARWTEASWHAFQALVGKEYGVSWKRNHELFPAATDVPTYLLPFLPNLEVAHDTGLPNGFTHRWSFDALIVETPIYMARLMTVFTETGGRIVRKRFLDVNDILHLSERIVFNCTGLGTRTLFDDSNMYAVKGQLLLHAPVHLDFAVGAGDFALIPRADALIIGSLFQHQFDDASPSADSAELLISTILGWCESSTSIFDIPKGSISRGKVRGSLAGLRPYRRGGIRVDAEEIEDKWIIHNYGHGGGGITLSWGCVQNAIELFRALDRS
jgi:D-amino-acid oxidase